MVSGDWGPFAMIIRAPWGHRGGVAHADGAIQRYKWSHSTFNVTNGHIQRRNLCNYETGGQPPCAQTSQLFYVSKALQL